jgi:predicted transcriptional regulator
MIIMIENQVYFIYIIFKYMLLGLVVYSKQIESSKNEPDFKPSTKTLERILKIMVDKGAEAKTTLSVDSNLNYQRLSRHIVWMEAKGLVESTIDESKIKVGLTGKGREFASTLSND